MGTNYRRIHTEDDNLEAIQDSITDELHRLSEDIPWLNPTRTIVADYTARPHDMVLCDPTTAGFVVTLPLSKPGDHVLVKNHSDSLNTITIRAAGGGTVDGLATAAITIARGWWLFIATRSGCDWVQI